MNKQIQIFILYIYNIYSSFLFCLFLFMNIIWYNTYNINPISNDSFDFY